MLAILNNLGNSCLTRFQRLGPLSDLTDLNRSISVLNKAIHIVPDNDAGRPTILNNLGNSLLSRFERLDELSDLNGAISVFKDATCLIQDGHTSKADYLSNIGNATWIRFKRLSKREDQEAALLCFSSAAKSLSGSLSTRFIASARWAKCSHRGVSNSPLEAYHVAISLIPRLAWLGSTITDRHQQVMKAGTVVRDAVAAVITIGKYDTAIEWLEQGRSIIWGQLQDLCSPLNDLREVKPEFANRLVYLSSHLQGADPQLPTPTPSAKVPIVRHHELAHEREKLLKEIRKLEDFKRFLLPKNFSDLTPAADKRPVIMLNISEFRCDALILMPGLDVLHVPLKDFTLEDALFWNQCLQLVLQNGQLHVETIQRRFPRKASRIPDHGTFIDREVVLVSILSELWKYIAKPILDALSIKLS